METYVNLNYHFKEQLDKLFEKNAHTTAEDIVSTFTDEFVNVPHIGYMPKEYAENADKIYQDRLGFMMSNDGYTPEEYFVQRCIEKSTAMSIVDFYQNENGIERSLKELAKYLYRHDELKFSNILQGVYLVPISPKHLRGKTARDYVQVHKLYKPRYYQVCKAGGTIRRNGQGAFAAVIQPDSRKNEFIEPFGPGYFIVNPFTIMRL